MATMRKLKLQVQMTVDGFVAGPEGQLDWMTRDLDEGVIAGIIQLTDSSDTILLGRGMTAGSSTTGRPCNHRARNTFSRARWWTRRKWCSARRSRASQARMCGWRAATWSTRLPG